MLKEEHEAQTPQSDEKSSTVVSIAEKPRANTPAEDYSDPEFADIRDHWSWVKPGIEEILADSPHLSYLPEDVYAECISGKSALYVTPIGFAVVSVSVDEYSKERRLFIWLAWAKDRGEHKWLLYEDWLNLLAVDLECNRIEARSSVLELQPYALATGWDIDTVIYSREV